MWARITISMAALAALTGCEQAPAPEPTQRIQPVYEGVETRLLDGDLVNFHVTLSAANGPGDVEDYAKCAAAQYALIRGYGFARHLRTNVYEEGGLWRGDAVYTISAALPRGLKTIDAEVIASACAENGIPMV